MSRTITRRHAVLAAVAAIALGACATAAASASGALTGDSGTGPVKVRLGYFANVTHATALVGVERGIFADHLGPDVRFQPATFKAGGEVIAALFADSIDAAYVGPIPAINGYVKSGGQALRIVSGATSGGAFLVVRRGITAQRLKGAKIASPQLGNTQDIALRAWLKQLGYSADEYGGGDVSILPQDNALTLNAFKAGQIDGAWVPEPWATRLVEEGGATVLVDERDLWPEGKFVTTNLIVATKFLTRHPDIVKHLLEGQVAANDYVNAHPDEAQGAVNDQIEKITGKRIKDDVLAAAWKNLSFTNDPLASSLDAMANSMVGLGLLGKADVRGIYDLALLRDVLRAHGLPPLGDRS